MWWCGVGWGGVVWLSRSGSERSSGRRRHRDTGKSGGVWYGGVVWWGGVVWYGLVGWCGGVAWGGVVWLLHRDTGKDMYNVS